MNTVIKAVVAACLLVVATTACNSGFAQPAARQYVITVSGMT